MNVRQSKKHLLSTMRRKVLLIILLILISIEIVLFIFIKNESMRTLDIKITKSLQKFFITENKEESEESKEHPFLLSLVHVINDLYSPYIILSVIYNFCTVYDCFILVNVLSIDYIFSFIFKIMYNNPGYFFQSKNEENIKIFYCGYGWGFPSEESIIAVSFYLSIWKICCKLSFKFNQIQKIIKYFFLCLIIMLLLFYNICTLLSGYYFFSHIIFSNIFGLIVYLIFFESNFFNLLDGGEFMNFLDKYNLLYIIINLSLYVIFSGIFFYLRLTEKEKQKYGICTAEDGNKYFNSSGNYNSYLDGTYCFCMLFLGNIFASTGLILDIKCAYSNNEFVFYQINFPQEFGELMDTKSKSSFSDSIHITRDMTWNNTQISISFLRLFIVLVFCWSCFFPYIFVSLTDTHIVIILTIKIFLPPMLFFLGIFFYLKPILKLMKLTNNTYHSLSDDI